jgi:preprotein translocase subunit SecY
MVLVDAIHCPTSLALTAGSMFVMWLSELITDAVLLTGASLIDFLNIVSALPTTLGKPFDLAQSGCPRNGRKVVILLLVFLS